MSGQHFLGVLSDGAPVTASWTNGANDTAMDPGGLDLLQCEAKATLQV